MVRHILFTLIAFCGLVESSSKTTQLFAPFSNRQTGKSRTT